MAIYLVRGSWGIAGGVERFPTFTLDTPNHFWYNRKQENTMRKTKEEKVADKLAELVDSASLNLDEVGRILGRGYNLPYNRLILIVEAMEAEKEYSLVRNSNTPLF